MPTTYELYTNENGTPKAVEGKAPAIVERVENLETSVESLETSVESLETSVESFETSVESLETSVETAQATAEACLPLAGGTMKGAIGFEGIGYLQCKNSTSKGIQIYGGDAFAEGAFLGVYGKDHASRAGWFYANANNGVNSSALIGKPDGTLTWGGHLVERVNTKLENVICYQNGLMICWAVLSTNSEGVVNWTFPVPFKNTNYSVSAVIQGSSYHVWTTMTDGATTSSINVWVRKNGYSSGESQQVRAMAVGYWM